MKKRFLWPAPVEAMFLVHFAGSENGSLAISLMI
jgi:hypothetical protein